jgi:hypothetical protein
MAHEADCLDTQHYGSVWADKLLRFAILVAAAEREACAKVCENDFLLHYDPVQTQTNFVTAIRARGQA